MANGTFGQSLLQNLGGPVTQALAGNPINSPLQQGSWLSQLFGGKPERRELYSGYTPENQATFDQLIGNILGQYQGGGFDFEPIAQKARSQFEQKTVPTLAERFTAMGGGQRSSAFQQSLGQAGSGLEESLAALGSQQGMQQQQLLQNLLSLGRQEPVLRQREPGFAESFSGTAAQGLSSLLPLLLML